VMCGIGIDGTFASGLCLMSVDITMCSLNWSCM